MLHFATARRDTTGLALTAGIHLLLGAAFVGLGIIPISRITNLPPISTTNINEPPKVAPKFEPAFGDETTTVVVAAPPIDFVATPSDEDFSVLALPDSDFGIGGAGGAEPANPPLPIVVAPRLDHRFAASFQPPYPESARRAAEEGRVILRVLVGPDGRPSRVEVEQSSGHSRLDAAAIRHALRAWRFTPGTRGDVVTAMWTKVPVLFRLAER